MFDFWRRYSLKCVRRCVDGDMWGAKVWPGGKWIVLGRGLPWERGKKTLCIVPCHSCYIYETWKSKFKRWWKKPQRMGAIFMGTGVYLSRHHDLASLHELCLFILLFRPLPFSRQHDLGGLPEIYLLILLFRSFIHL